MKWDRGLVIWFVVFLVPIKKRISTAGSHELRSGWPPIFKFEPHLQRPLGSRLFEQVSFFWWKFGIWLNRRWPRCDYCRLFKSALRLESHLRYSNHKIFDFSVVMPNAKHFALETWSGWNFKSHRGMTMTALSDDKICIWLQIFVWVKYDSAQDVNWLMMHCCDSKWDGLEMWIA